MPPTSPDHDLRLTGLHAQVKLPPGFLWGVSTAAHQVEGGNDNNQWAAWEAAGRVKSQHSCGNACDWWERAECDFDLARDLGLNSMRLSVEWSRIEPRQNVWDKAAIQRYRSVAYGHLLHFTTLPTLTGSSTKVHFLTLTPPDCLSVSPGA